MTILGSEFLLTLLLVNVALAYAVYPMAVVGRTSVAPVAYLAIGAYAGAFAVERDRSIWLGCLAGLAISVAAAILLSLVVGHLRSHYFVAATLGLTLIVQQLAFGLPGITNGYLGITEPAGLVSQAQLWLLVAACVAGAISVRYSFQEPVWRAVGEDDRIASALGISVRRQVTVAGVVSAVIATIAGTMYGNLIAFFDPNTFGFLLILYLIVAVVVGGTASWYGPILGGIVMTVLPEALRVFGSLREAVLGLVLALCIIFLPGGLSDVRGLRRALSSAFRRLVRMRARRAVASGQPAPRGDRTNDESTVDLSV